MSLPTASVLRHWHIGGISVQDQVTGQFVLLQLELFLDMERQHRTESVFLFLPPLSTTESLLGSLWHLHVVASPPPQSSCM